MSDLMAGREVSDSKDCPAHALKPIHEKIMTRNAHIGKGLTIRRALPSRERRMIGAWCFFDHFGPLNLKEGGLIVAPHPHIGLQTFTWTLAGEILHRDSLGSKQVIQPGAINLMTAGKGIAHSEESLPDDVLHGVQLWIALPDEARQCEPEFSHYPVLPMHEQDGLLITVLAGDLYHLHAPTKVYSPLVGLDLNALNNVATTLPLNPEFEYGIMVLSGKMSVEDETLQPGTLLYIGCGRSSIAFTMPKDARVFIIGGKPFEEEILLWWNFVARSRQEIIDASEDWENQVRFGEVVGFQGERLSAPAVPGIK
ncbi:MAG: pirin family protein [Gammaproteobacteria bacterium]|nr:pirin family protein [Gammaproteobacteria bacterium]